MGTSKINVCVGVIWGRKGQSGYVRRAGQAGNWSVPAGLMYLADLPEFPMLHSPPVAQGFVNSLQLSIQILYPSTLGAGASYKQLLEGGTGCLQDGGGNVS